MSILKRAAALAFVPALLAAGQAQAATSVGVNGTDLVVGAALQRENLIDVFPQGTDVIVRDFGDVVLAGPGCAQLTAISASCPRAGLNRVIVNARDRADKVRKFTGDLNSRINGGSENDILVGGPAPDLNELIGGPDTDTLLGGPDTDRLDGQGGADVMSGGLGRDTVTYAARIQPVQVTLDGVDNDGEASEGDDVAPDVENVIGGSSDDRVVGTISDNRFEGGRGVDELHGMGGADTLIGGFGDDQLFGYDGNDSFLEDGLVSVADGADRIVGGPGVDLVSYANRTASVVVSLNAAAGDGEAGENDTVGPDVENVTGGRNNDTLGGSTSVNELVGGAGRDSLIAGPNDDRLDGGPGADMLIGESGRDIALYSTRSAPVAVTIDNVADDGEAQEGDNVHPTVEDVEGGSAADSLTGSASGNRLLGKGGWDTLRGLDGPDTLIGGASFDRLFGGPGDDLLDGLDFISGNDTLNGEADTDTCRSDAGDSEVNCEL
jgi:Ca2+-binding RTX toxin-like protein